MQIKEECSISESLRSVVRWLGSVVKEPISHALTRAIDLAFWLSVAYLIIETIPVLWERFFSYVMHAPISEKAMLAAIGLV